MQRIYYWENDSFGDDENTFNTGILLDMQDGRYSSGAHSGGLVVLAKNKIEAVDFVMKYLELKNEKAREYLLKTISEFKDKEGVIYWGDGGC